MTDLSQLDEPSSEVAEKILSYSLSVRSSFGSVDPVPGTIGSSGTVVLTGGARD